MINFIKNTENMGKQDSQDKKNSGGEKVIRQGTMKSGH